MMLLTIPVLLVLFVDGELLVRGGVLLIPFLRVWVMGGVLCRRHVICSTPRMPLMATPLSMIVLLMLLGLSANDGCMLAAHLMLLR